MRISDWSSDVCSSDLCLGRGVLGTGEHHLRAGVLVVHAKQAVVRIVGAERQTDVADEVVVVAELTHLRSEEHTSELQSLMRISYAVFCLKQKRHTLPHTFSTMHYTSVANRHKQC